MEFAFRRKDSLSGNWSYLRRSKCLRSIYGSQDFEKIESLSSSVEGGMTRSNSLPNLGPEDLSQTWAPRRQETYYEMISDLGYWTNLKYRLGFLGQSIYFKSGGDVKKAYLLGEEYIVCVDGEEKQDQLEKLNRNFYNIIWFSYRKNFPKLNHQHLPDEESYVSDTGWGCTLRSCQMLFAACLKKHLTSVQGIQTHNKFRGKSPYDKQEHQALQVSEKAIHDSRNIKIISWFLDCEINPKLAPYSIQNLCNYIYENSHIRPGNWLKPSTVLYALQGTHQKLSKYTVPNMQMEIYLEGTIYIDQAIKKVGIFKPEENDSSIQNLEQDFEVVEDEETDNKIPLDTKSIHSQVSQEGEAQPKKIPKANTISDLFTEDGEELEKLLKAKWKDSLMIVVLAKIGLDKPNPEYLPFIKELLTLEESMGMLGGKPGLAFFIVGFVEDRLMYLDPHFVQEAVQDKKDLKKNLESYFCSSIRYVSLGEIDTSVGFAFWIKDEISFEQFIKKFKRVCRRKDCFLGIEVKAPQEYAGDFESVDGEDEFEMIAVK